MIIKIIYIFPIIRDFVKGAVDVCTSKPERKFRPHLV